MIKPTCASCDKDKKEIEKLIAKEQEREHKDKSYQQYIAGKERK